MISDSGVVDSGASHSEGGPSDASIPDGNVSAPSSDGSTTKRLVTVQIVDAVVGPGQQNGDAWDGIGTISLTVRQEIAAALLGATPYAAVTAILAGQALAQVAKPDPYGEAQATVAGMPTSAVPLAVRGSEVVDTFTPPFTLGWYYQNVPIDTDVRIAVRLWDEDLSDDDYIGTGVINSSDLMAALIARKKWYVDVSEQTQGQLLLIGINVAEQVGPLP